MPTMLVEQSVSTTSMMVMGGSHHHLLQHQQSLRQLKQKDEEASNVLDGMQVGVHGGSLMNMTTCRWTKEAGLWRKHSHLALARESASATSVAQENNFKMLDLDGTRKRLQVSGGIFSRMASGGGGGGDTRPACKKVRKQLLCCRVCQGDYVRPKVLPCLHTFCEQCLVSEVPAHSLAVTCPTCRQQSILPLEGVSGLHDNVVLVGLMDAIDQLVSCAMCQTASAVSTCLECIDSFCQSCATTHSELEPQHTVVALPASPTVLSTDDAQKALAMAAKGDLSVLLACPKHAGRQLDLYCADCETIICATCCSTAGEHEGHTACPLASTVEEHRRLLADLLCRVKTQLAVVQGTMDTVKGVSASLLDNYRAAETRVRECFDTLSRALLERKDLVLSDLEAAYRAKHDRLAGQLRDLQEAAGGLSKNCVFTESALGRASELEMLLVRKEMADKLMRLSTDDELPRTTPVDTDALAFADSDLSRVVDVVRGFGSIATTPTDKRILSSWTWDAVATGDGLKWAYAGQPAIVHVSTRLPPMAGSTRTLSTPTLTALVTSLTNASDIITPIVSDCGPGNYTVSYTASRQGTYQIDLRLGGQHVPGSPFIVMAMPAADGKDGSAVAGDDGCSSSRTSGQESRGKKRQNSSSHGSAAAIDDDLVARMGRKGRCKGEFTNPQGVCCAPGGRYVVADSNNQCVQVFSDTGSCKLRFGARGRLPGQLLRPTGVAILPNGNLLVADYENKWVNVFAPDGKYVSRIGAGKLLGPKGLCVDQRGHVVVVDNKASCLFVFQPNGKLLLKFGSRGSGESHFAGPHFCAVTPDNDYVVTDFHNHSVKVFDTNGVFKFSFGSNGEGNGQFNAPTGVAIDSRGNILVADWGNSRIQVFDRQGSFLSYINTAAEPLYGPQGLCLTDSGQVLVADSGNHCLKVYKYTPVELPA